MQHAHQRVREITARERLRLPVEEIAQDLNRFLAGWAGYFRYGNSAQFFDKITLHAVNRLSIIVANRHRVTAGSDGGSSAANPRTGSA